MGCVFLLGEEGSAATYHQDYFLLPLVCSTEKGHLFFYFSRFSRFPGVGIWFSIFMSTLRSIEGTREPWLSAPAPAVPVVAPDSSSNSYSDCSMEREREKTNDVLLLKRPAGAGICGVLPMQSPYSSAGIYRSEMGSVMPSGVEGMVVIRRCYHPFVHLTSFPAMRLPHQFDAAGDDACVLAGVELFRPCSPRRRSAL